MYDLLFSVPWWIPTLLTVVGLALLVSGNRRQASGLQRAGGALIVLAIAWAVVSFLVETPKETCQKQTRQFIQSLVDRDWKTFYNLLAGDADFRAPTISWQITGRDALSAAVKADIEQIGLKSVSITAMDTTQTEAAITTRVTVFSTQDFTMDRPIDSVWDMEWRNSPAGWKLHEVRSVQISGVTADQVRSSLKKH